VPIANCSAPLHRPACPRLQFRHGRRTRIGRRFLRALRRIRQRAAAMDVLQ